MQSWFFAGKRSFSSPKIKWGQFAIITKLLATSLLCLQCNFIITVKKPVYINLKMAEKTVFQLQKWAWPKSRRTSRAILFPQPH